MNKGRQHLRGQNLKEGKYTEMSKHFPLHFPLEHWQKQSVVARVCNSFTGFGKQKPRATKAARTQGANSPEKREQKKSKSDILNGF